MSLLSDLQKVKKKMSDKAGPQGGVVYKTVGGKFIFKNETFNKFEDLPMGQYLLIPRVINWHKSLKRHMELILKK